MNKTTWIIIVVVLAILAIIFGVMWNNASVKAKKLAQAQEELQKSILEKEEPVTAEELQNSIDALGKELGLIGAGTEFPVGTPEELKARNLNTLNTARTKIAEYKKQIADLESKIAANKKTMASMQSTVDRLKKSLAEKERIVAELEGRVSALNGTLDSERKAAQEEIAKRENMLKEKESELNKLNIDNNTLYYAIGTRKQLLDSGIITRKGGILGIGKVSTLKDVNLTKFSQFNLLETQEITFPVTKKGYSVLSNHVAASYEVRQEGDQYVLKITDPEQFRKQKVLVIELK
jgi:DNA repair exonuclease SbcCD ATPase subunit